MIPNFIEQPKRSVADYTRKKAIAVGRLEDSKGFDILIDCWKRVLNSIPTGTWTYTAKVRAATICNCKSNNCI